MLNGIAPIFLFQFFKLTPSLTAKLNEIPILADLSNFIVMPPIPLYLDEKLTGIYIDSESKNIDLETDVEAKKDGSDPTQTQRAVNSSVTIEMLANSDSIGLTILSAMMDVILPKVASREYSISYLHGAVTVFQGKLHSFSINQNAENSLYKVTVNLAQSSKSLISSIPVVGKITGALPL